VAKDVRRDVQVISTDQLESGFIMGRVRTINVLYSAKGLISEPEFGELKKIKIDEIWEWSGHNWGLSQHRVFHVMNNMYAIHVNT